MSSLGTEGKAARELQSLSDGQVWRLRDGSIEQNEQKKVISSCLGDAFAHQLTGVNYTYQPNL